MGRASSGRTGGREQQSIHPPRSCSCSRSCSRSWSCSVLGLVWSGLVCLVWSCVRRAQTEVGDPTERARKLLDILEFRDKEKQGTLYMLTGWVRVLLACLARSCRSARSPMRWTMSNWRGRRPRNIAHSPPPRLAAATRAPWGSARGDSPRINSRIASALVSLRCE